MMINAHFSQDVILLEAFREKQDVHSRTAKEMFKLDCLLEEVKKFFNSLRQRGKVINFLLIYGGSEFALSKQLDIPKEEARENMLAYFAVFTGVRDWMVEQVNFGKQHEYIYTVLGRRGHVEGINSSNWKIKGHFERLALNKPIQGSAADITMSAQLLIEADKDLKKLKYRQILQVHDEIVGVIPKRNIEKAIPIILKYMRHPLPQPLNGVDLDADYGYSTVSYARAKG